MPVYFESPATEVSRYRAGKSQARDRQEQIAREILEDANADNAEREWARSVVVEPVVASAEN